MRADASVAFAAEPALPFILLAITVVTIIGLKIDAPIPGWTGMLADGRNYVQTPPWRIFSSGTRDHDDRDGPRFPRANCGATGLVGWDGPTDMSPFNESFLRTLDHLPSQTRTTLRFEGPSAHRRTERGGAVRVRSTRRT